MSERNAIKTFGDTGTRDIFVGRNTKKSRKVLPKELHSKAREIMDALDQGINPMDLKIYNPEPLTGYDFW